MASSYKKTIVLGLDNSEFTGGISECNSKMKELDAEFKKSQAEMGNGATASERYANKAQYLSEKMEVQKRKVELARQKYEDLKNSQADTAAIDRARMALTREETELANLNNQYNAAIINQSNFKQTAMAAVAVLTALAAGLVACANGAAEYADNMNTLSMQTGVSAQTLQEWDYAAELMDTSLETITSSFSKMERSMASNAEAFSALGISVTDSSGNMRSAEAVFYEVIDALGKIENQTERDQAAMSIFGRSAQELAGVINAGSQGLREYAEEAESLGRIMSEEDLQAANNLSDATARLTSAWKSVKNEIGVGAAPVLTAIANVINKIPTDILATVSAVVGLTAATGAVVVVITAAKVAYTALLPEMKAVTAEMMAQGGYITLIVGMIYTVIAAIQKLKTEYESLADVMEQKGYKNDFWSMNKWVFGRELTDAKTGEVYHYASGGVARGGTAWVGENGPELVNLPAGARVYNNEESKQIAGGNTYNITMNCDLSKMKSVNDVINAISGLNDSMAAGGY